jgi:hypothetical protein
METVLVGGDDHLYLSRRLQRVRALATLLGLVLKERQQHELELRVKVRFGLLNEQKRQVTVLGLSQLQDDH